MGDGNKSGGYATVFFDVQPVDVSLNFDGLAAGDKSAMIPDPQVNGGGNPYTILDLGFPSNLPVGSTVSLTMYDGASAQVWDGVPGDSGSTELLDANNGTYTWTVNTGFTPPTTLDVVGTQATNVDQVGFILRVAIASVEQGATGTPPPGTPGQPVAASQPATVAANTGLLMALDGTRDDAAKNTDIYQFWSAHYDAQKPSESYQPGVGSAARNKISKFRELKDLVAGDREASSIEQEALTIVKDYYLKDASRHDTPLDLIGYSRGSVEVVKLVNDLFKDKIPSGAKSTTRPAGGGPPTNQYAGAPFVPRVRFVGLMSPVMGPFAEDDSNYPLTQLNWTYTLPAAVGAMYQALDHDADLHKQNWPIEEALLPQRPVTLQGSDGSGTKVYMLSHVGMASDQTVLNDMIGAAKKAGVPCH